MLSTFLLIWGCCLAVVQSFWCVAGCVLWLVGFLFEAVADAQLLAFQRDPRSHGRVLDSGLWRYSRHPNYFGEALLWWGFVLGVERTSSFLPRPPRRPGSR